LKRLLQQIILTSNRARMRGTSQMAVFQQLAKVFSMDCVRTLQEGRWSFVLRSI